MANKWEVESVIPPDLISVNATVVLKEEQNKLYDLLEKGFEPFAVFGNRIWLRLKLD